MKYYLDEDISPKVAELLRGTGVDAVSAHEKGMLGVSDEEQMMAAAKEKRVPVTRNSDDFIRLTVGFFEDLRSHYGLIIIPHSIPGSNFSLLARLLSEHAQKHPEGLDPYTIEFVSRDAFLRQCLKLRNHYTTGSELIYVNNYVFRITCQGILM